uniref:CCDC81 HU domain-containing protein n=1 Tax=Meleagris gallopavo TaxID=9103 RepID=G4VXP7_MELGA|nr:hypothetical protein [Meleagris gallopavo]
MAGANKERSARVIRKKISFWEDGPATERASRSPDVTAKERVAVWDAVAVCVQQQLLLHKGVRIPTFGSFDIVSKQIKTKDETLVVKWPAFRLARNLLDVHGLMGDEEFLPGRKEAETLKYTEVAAAASVSRQRGEICICGTTSLVSRCLKKGENVAFVLKDIGVLILEGARVQMKFYYDFLEKVCGKANLETAVFKVPWLLDMVVSRVAAAASLTLSGRVVVFPEFQLEFVPKPPPRKPSKASGEVPGEGKQEKAGGLPPLVQSKKGKIPELPPLPGRLSITSREGTCSGKGTRVDQKSSVSSQVPVIPAVSSARKMAVPSKTQGEGTTKSTAPPMGPATKAHRCKEEQGAVKPALTSQGQHKLPAQAKAPGTGRTHGVEPQRCIEERGAVKPVLTSQGQHKLPAQAKAPGTGRTHRVEPQRCKEERGAVKPVLTSQLQGKHTDKAPAQGSGRAQAVESRWFTKQGAVKPALTSPFQGKLIATAKPSEMRPAQAMRAQRCKEEERGAVKPALTSQFLGKYPARVPAPEAGRARAVASQSIRERRGAEKICDGTVLDTDKEKLSRPHGAQAPMIIPKIVIQSPSSSEHSLPEEPIYDTNFLMPPPRFCKRRRARKRCVIPIRIIPGCHLPVQGQRWRNSRDSPKTPCL